MTHAYACRFHPGKIRLVSLLLQRHSKVVHTGAPDHSGILRHQDHRSSTISASHQLHWVVAVSVVYAQRASVALQRLVSLTEP